MSKIVLTVLYAYLKGYVKYSTNSDSTLNAHIVCTRNFDSRQFETF